MKIAIFIDSLAIGGAQKHVRQMACGLAQRGHEIVVYCLNDVAHPVHREALSVRGVELKVLGRTKVLSGVGVLEVIAALGRDGCDVIVTVLFVSTVFGRVIAGLLGGIPVVTCLQARNVNYTAVQKRLVRATAWLTDFTVSNSRCATVWAVENEGVDPRRCEFVANALDPIAPMRFTESDPESTWTAFGFPELEGRKVIGSLGRLHRQKGYDILLDSFAGIAGAFAEFDVLLVGDGPERVALLEQMRRLGLEGRVWLAGERADPRPLLEKMDVYVQPSRYEGTPNALMEAMALGRPVVATSVDGISELIDGGVEGWLVPSENRPALALALGEACAEPSRRTVCGERACRRVTGEFGLDAMVDNYGRIFRELVEGNGPKKRSGWR